MRQVFSSPRLENVEGVAQLLRDAGIEVRVSDGRSYKRNLRGDFRYTDNDSRQPAVWVVQSAQQLPARELLREAGLIDSTRGDSAYTMPVFRTETPVNAGDPARKRVFKMKMALLAIIVGVVALGLVRMLNRPAPVQVLAAPPFDGTPAATLVPVALAVFRSEIANAGNPVICLGVDGTDASAAVIDALAGKADTVVPASACERIADEDIGSYHRATGDEAMIVEVRGFRPSAPNAGQIEFSAYQHRMSASYKTLEVGRVEERWQVTKVLKHVENRGLIGF